MVAQSSAQRHPLPDASFRDLFAVALTGHPCTVLTDHTEEELPLRAWQADATHEDQLLLRHCAGTTLDIGCGPGRLVAALGRRGHVALGIDVVPTAVEQARDRGGVALLRDVFGPVPAEGLWDTALLADGNIGIGGDPDELLVRCRRLVRPGLGRAVVEVGPPGTGLRRTQARLRCAGRVSRPFAWAEVGAEAIGALAGRAGFGRTTVHRGGSRWCAVLEQAR